MPGVDGPATDKLYALGANWLKGASIKKHRVVKPLRHPARSIEMNAKCRHGGNACRGLTNSTCSIRSSTCA